MKKLILPLVKLAVLGVLITVIVGSIQIDDSYTLVREDNDGKVLESIETVGVIRGAWNRREVSFVTVSADGSELTESLQPGEQPDGRKLAIKPGFLTYLRNLDLVYFLLGALCFFFAVNFAAMRWWWLMRCNQLAITPWEAWRFTWIGNFFNNFMLGQTGGDLIKAVYIVKHCPDGRVAALVSVIVDRVLGLGSLALLGAVLVLFSLDRFPEIAIGIWVVLIGVGVGGVIAFSKRIRHMVRLDAILKKLPPRLSGLLQRVDQAVYYYRSHKKGILIWMFAGTFNHVVSVLSYLFIGKAIGVGMPTAEYFVLVPVISIVSAIPLAPNGWGVGEFMFGNLFAVYGAVYLKAQYAEAASQVMYSRGVALSVLHRIHISLWSLIGGLLLLFERDRVTRQDLDAEVALEEEEATHPSQADTTGSTHSGSSSSPG